MTFHRRAAMAAAISLIVAACGSSADSTTTTEAVGAGGATEATVADPTTTTTTAPTTTAAPTTTTTEAVSARSDCLVGSWELDSAAFIEQIFSAGAGETGFEELGEVEISHGGGSFIVTMNEDGTYVGVRDDWQIRLSADEGTFVNTLDGEEAGTWSVDGDQLTVTPESSTISVSFAAEIDGVLQDLPFGGTQTVSSRELGGTGPFTCDDDTLRATFEGSTSTFTRR
ncbi:MAG: lipocalin family protein [Acidimicrobiia bacterium]|nr:lipocalin family protein [Acidimicrobiia bacterium]